jgi:hypothetical protein
MEEKEDGIFKIFSQLTLADYLSEIEFNSQKGSNFNAIYQLINYQYLEKDGKLTVYPYEINSNDMITITFLKRFLRIKRFFIRFPGGAYCNKVRLEAFTDRNQWEIIGAHEFEYYRESPEIIIQMKIDNPVLCNSLRLTFFNPHEEEEKETEIEPFNSSIEVYNFEIYGEITEMSRFIKKIRKPVKIPPYLEFEYHDVEHQGLFYFFQNLSVKARCDVYQFVHFGVSGKNTPEILTLWDKGSWNSNDAHFNIYLGDEWKFKPTGFRLKAGEEKFITDWSVSNGQDPIIENQSHGFISNGEEISFPLSFLTFSMSFSFSFYGEVNSRISFAGFEIFGILKRYGMTEEAAKEAAKKQATKYKCCLFL